MRFLRSLFPVSVGKLVCASSDPRQIFFCPISFAALHGSDCALHGVALMVLPTLVVGNELLILGGVAVAVGGWFLAHRHGQLKGFVDANKNGVDDRAEAKERRVESQTN